MISLLELINLQSLLRAGNVTARHADGYLWNLVDDRVIEYQDDTKTAYKRDPKDTIAFDTCPTYTSNMNTITKLIEEVRPEWLWMMRKSHNRTYCGVIVMNNIMEDFEEGRSCTYTCQQPALALGIAFIDALVLDLTDEYRKVYQ